MALLRLIIGPAGSGKTHRILAEATQNIAGDAGRQPSLLNQPPLLVLVPEQQAMMTERMLLEHLSRCDPPVGAVSNLRVFSLTRLGNWLNDLSGELRPMPTETGRRLITWRLCEPGPRRNAKAEALAQMVAELDLYNTAATDAELHPKGEGSLSGRAAELETEAAGVKNPVRRRLLLALVEKLRELASLIEAYRNECGRLEIGFRPAAAHINRQMIDEHWPQLRDARIWIDGFMGFTPPEEQALLTLLKTCRSVTASVLIPPEHADEEEEQSFNAVEDWFAPTRELYRKWHRLAGMAGARVEVLAMPAEGGHLPRWEQGSPLAGIAIHGLQEPYTLLPGDESQSSKTTGPAREGKALCAEMTACADERVEAELAVRRIQSLVRERGYRYGDISVISRDLAPYVDLFSARCRDYGIPFYVDRRPPLDGHPAVEVVRCGTRLALGLARDEDVYALIKTGLMPGVDDGETADGKQCRDWCDRMEIYARAHGLKPYHWVSDRKWQHAPSWFRREVEPDQAELDGMHAWRMSLMDPVIKLQKTVAEHRTAGINASALLGAIWNNLAGPGMQSQVSAWTGVDAGMGELAIGHSEVYGQLAKLFDELALVSGDVMVQQALAGEDPLAMDYGEFCRWLEFGLSQLTLGHPPSTLDRVVLTDIERGRHPGVKASLLLGLAEDSWPPGVRQTAYLSDLERELINRPAEGGPELHLVARGSADNAQREPYLAMVAATRASEFLYGSCPLADDQGRERKPSRYFLGLCEALGLEPAHHAGEPRQLPEVLASTDDGNSPVDIALASAIKDAEKGLRQLAMEMLDGSPVAGAFVWACNYRGGAGRRPMAGNASLLRMELPGWPRELFRLRDGEETPSLHLSASQLETYADCPFKYLAQHMLRLDDGAESEFSRMHIGDVYHHVLQSTVQELIDRHGRGEWDWGKFDWREFSRLCEPVLAELTGILAGVSGRKRAAHVEERGRLLLAQVARYLEEQFTDGQGRHPVFTELVFGRGGGGPGPLRLEFDDLAVVLNGKIDRLDIMDTGRAVVTDYKLGTHQFELWQLRSGKALQLSVYLMAIDGWQGGGSGMETGLTACQAEYQRIEPGRTRQSLEFEACQVPKPKGNYDDEARQALSDGLLVSHLFTETRAAIHELAGRLWGLRFTPWPLRSPDRRRNACQYCAYHPVCRFDPLAFERYRETSKVDERQVQLGLLADRSGGGREA